MKPTILVVIAVLAHAVCAEAQTFDHFITTEKQAWQQARRVTLTAKSTADELLRVDEGAVGHEFRAWGTCFNELDLDALLMLSKEEQEEVMHRVFAPDGDLRFTRGRLTMNANDYSREWYSCDTVAGDFALNCFNIEHDKANVIRLIRMAQRQQPQLTFWLSPWSPPAWMKVNNDYCVMSSPWNTQPREKDYLLYGGGEVDPTEVMNAGQQQGHLFPARLATQSYIINDPRYLQTYADMFCRFIDLYAEEHIPIDMVMYQNEAYSYTAYPGCPWTADATLRFNRDYLVPTLHRLHPEVQTYIGTINTNRLAYVEHFIDGLTAATLEDGSPLIAGIGLQWEGRELIDSLRVRYPSLHIISSESECGNGSMDWRAGEHTFHLLADYIGRGCDEYFIWNFILADNGRSSWGWTQNALVQVNSEARSVRYTPEFFAVKHFSHFVTPGSQVLAYVAREQTEGVPIIVFRRTDGRHVVVMGNQTDSSRTVSLRLRRKHLTAAIEPHSFHTFVER